MKELNIMEASNMLNTEFEVIYPSGDKRTTNIKTNAIGNLLECDTGELSECCIGIIKAKFIPIQQPVNFMEAITDDKNMVKVILNTDDFFSSDAECFNDYMTINELFKKLSERF